MISSFKVLNPSVPRHDSLCLEPGAKAFAIILQSRTPSDKRLGKFPVETGLAEHVQERYHAKPSM